MTTAGDREGSCRLPITRQRRAVRESNDNPRRPSNAGETAISEETTPIATIGRIAQTLLPVIGRPEAYGSPRQRRPFADDRAWRKHVDDDLPSPSEDMNDQAR